MEEKIDATNLLHEYIQIEQYLSEDPHEKYNSLPWDVQIRVLRAFALIVAYQSYANNETEPDQDIIAKYSGIDDDKKLKFVVDFFSFNKYGLPPISQRDIEEIQTMLKEVIPDERNYKMALASSRELTDTEARIFQLIMLIKARVKSAEIRDVFNEYLGGIYCVLPYTMTKYLYFDHLSESDKKMDRLIILLLGTVFQRSFTKEELVNNYGYPKETDEDLLEYYVENM